MQERNAENVVIIDGEAVAGQFIEYWFARFVKITEVQSNKKAITSNPASIKENRH